jgi:hypothetical protein
MGAGQEVKESAGGHAADVRSLEEPAQVAQAAQAKRTGLMGKLMGATVSLFSFLSSTPASDESISRTISLAVSHLSTATD